MNRKWYKEILIGLIGAIFAFIFTFLGFKIDQINKSRQAAKIIYSAIEIEKFVTNNYILDINEISKLPKDSQVIPEIFKYGHDINFYYQFSDQIIYLDKEVQKNYFAFLVSVHRCSYARDIFYFGLSKCNNKIRENMDSINFYKLHLSKLNTSIDDLMPKLDKISHEKFLCIF